jgi:hypothetical protein
MARATRLQQYRHDGTAMIHLFALPAVIKSTSLAALAAVKRGKESMETKSRLAIDTAIIIFVMGLVFQAGVQYETTQGIGTETKQNHMDIEEIRRDAIPVNQKLEHIETMVMDLKEHHS